MFGNQNMATQLFPAGAQQAIFCPYYLYSGCYGYHSCWYNYYSICGWGYYSCHFGHYSITIVQQVQCPGITAIPGQVAPGDPVEGLRVLRQQLEVTLAGVRAQEAELQRQRAATSGE
jgi:hypothetical protein